ncbi:9266_t:CDS:1, partial [Racocetra persica]
ILEQTILAANSLQPTMIFTDTNLAMQVAIANKYSEAIVQYYIFYIHQNLIKKLKKKLHN